MNDRSLRDITIGLGGTANGVPRQDGFNITPASEVMAILCMASDLDNLKWLCRQHMKQTTSSLYFGIS